MTVEQILISKHTISSEYFIQASTNKHKCQVDHHSLLLDNLQIPSNATIASYCQTFTSQSDLKKNNPCTVDINKIQV